jgi:drug/metabolite transporter (DMT)-like permease
VVLARLVLHEQMNWMRIAGIGFIVLGVFAMAIS